MYEPGLDRHEWESDVVSAVNGFRAVFDTLVTTSATAHAAEVED
jgi:hypothetical protein